MSDADRRAALLQSAVGMAVPVSGDSGLPGWVEMAAAERVIPLLHRLVHEHAPPSVVREVTALQLEIAALSVRLEQSLLQVSRMLEEASIAHAVLKGVATANIDYADPAHRQFGDVDLLVSPGDLTGARSVMEGHGWRQAYPLPRHHEPFTHAVTFAGVGIAEIDVHQRIAHRALGLRIPTAELLGRRTAFCVAGQRLWALGDADRLIHACLHAVASRGQYRRLSSVADVLVLSRGRPGSDPEAVLTCAEGWRVRPLVEAAVRRAHAEARLTLPGVWSEAMATPTLRRDRLLERAYLGERRRPFIEELAHLRVMEGWSDRALYLYGHLHMDSGPGAGGLRNRVQYLRSRLQDR